MPETWATILVAIIAAVLGGSGGGFVVGRYRAKTEREQVLATASRAATEVALTAWRDLAAEREREAEKSRQEALVLRERLTEVECRLTETERRLTETERQLQAERDRNSVLEAKVTSLERERARWSKERAALMKRIEELEACR